MTVYYLKQDDTIWGCGDPECCGEYYEEIGEYFLECTCEVEVDADHLHSCNGGGPVLEWRKATDLETIAYQNGNQEGYSEGSVRGWDFAVKETEERIIKLLEEHIPIEDNYDIESSCRGCDWYWAWNSEVNDSHENHLIALIKGENKPFITAKQAEQLTDEMLEE